MGAHEGWLVALPLVWLALATWQQCRRWRILRPPVDRAETEARAEALLAEVLPAAEYASLQTRGYLELPSRRYAHRRYRIYRQPWPVEVYERGRRTQTLCVQPAQYLPTGDHVLMHKMLLEGDEARYLRTANVARLGRLDLLRREPLPTDALPLLEPIPRAAWAAGRSGGPDKTSAARALPAPPGA